MRWICIRPVRFAVMLAASLLILSGMLPTAAQDMTPTPISTSMYDPGLTLLNQGDYQGAIDAFTEIIQAGEADEWVYLYRAIAHNNNGERGLAFDDLDRAQAINPDLPRIYDYRAALYIDSNRNGNALVELNRALALDPTYYDAMVARAMVLIGLRNFDDALADLDAAIALQPESPWAYMMRGVLYANLPEPDYAAALRDYRQYAELMGDSVDQETLDRIAQFELTAEGTPVPPTPTLAYEVGATPTPSAYAAQQDALRAFQAGDYQAAVNAYTTAIDLNPTNADLYLGRAQSYIALQDFEAALEDANQAVSLQPDAVVSLHFRAGVNLLLGDNEAAIQDENAAITSNPYVAGAYLLRAIAFLRMEQTDKACADFDVFNQLAPHMSAPVLDDLRVYLESICLKADQAS